MVSAMLALILAVAFPWLAPLFTKFRGEELALYVSFGRMARFFRDVLHCPNALYLDGSVSSLWDRPAGRRDTNSELGPLVAVFEREGRR